MENGGGYVPPAYIPLEQSDPEASSVPREEEVSVRRSTTRGLTQWSSGICAFCDDMPSCCNNYKRIACPKKSASTHKQSLLIDKFTDRIRWRHEEFRQRLTSKP